ncbi:uncharacterized protein LOC119768917 [Culex quinquefasciatus]|uniref:uncharacterized protein LOC119768917 n=1 Tax=Culex quinquefasciatus TaxID=7176 RepID=UPI0018E2DBAE|nr:uncharacterized protein LOC119768917 [Culex quinquefasciatus]
MDQERLKSLTSKREVILAKVKWELSVAKAIKTRNPSLGEVAERRDKLTGLAQCFDDVQTEIEEATPNLEEVVTVFNHRILFEDAYFQIKDIYTEYLDQHVEEPEVRPEDRQDDLRDAVKALLESQQQMLLAQCQKPPPQTLALAAGSQVSNPVPHNVVKLPQIDIPKFTGERKHWRSFKDLFVCTIHSRTDLRDSVKMQYLFSYLDGEAKGKVDSFSINDGNYREAWDALVTYYDKHKYTVFALVREFVDQQPVTNAKELKHLVATSDDVVRQLKALGREYESRDPWLIHLLLEKVDRETRSLWAQKIITVENPTFANFQEFLEQRCDALETCSAFSKKTGPEVSKKESQKPTQRKVQAFHTSAAVSCAKCSKDHPTYHCDLFKAMDVAGRRELVLSKKLCFNCLKPLHTANKCPSKSTCRTPDCKQRHHTTLCQQRQQHSQEPEKADRDHPPRQPEETEEASSVSANAAQAKATKHEPSSVALLPTVIANLEGKDGKLHQVRCLVDSGSQASLITEACVKRIGLKRTNASLEVTGVNGEVVGTTAGAVTLVMSSRFDGETKLTTQAYVLGRLTATLPNQRFNVADLPFLEGLELADPSFNSPGEMDVILGADVFLSILQAGQVKNRQGIPVAQRSIFGWMEFDIDRTLRLFWEDQEIPEGKLLTTEEKRVIEHFDSTLTRSEKDGHFIVRLPLDDSKCKLGESLNAATKRLRAMERKFQRDPNFKERYVAFMREYQKLGHMEEIPETEVQADCTKSYYLPHHGVVKEDSSTTKLRVVFDGSCATTTGVSLNDLLLNAPNVNADLFDVLLRFRTYPVVFTADVEKMYRQVWVHRDDTDYQRIVWRESPDEPIRHFRLLTVTYGLKNSGFLAMSALKKAAEDFEQHYPGAAERIKEHTYVDDLVSGADSAAEAARLVEQIDEIAGKAGFTLRKWCSNVDEALLPLADVKNAAVPIQFPDERNAIKALGIHWLPQEDAFTFKVNMKTDGPNTKHQLLSDSAKLFDPIGWLAPVTVRAKILFQQCWLYDMNWHDPLPAAVEQMWIEFKENLPRLEQVKIPRWMSSYNGRVELHGFSDASEEAYSAVVYIRTFNEIDGAYVNIVAAKTKVAPIRQVSLPRLELNGAWLLARLMKRVAKAFERFKVEMFAYTDSTIVLHQLAIHPRKLDTYVANRTASILEVLPRSRWFHVKSEENPADCASRGISPAELVNHPLWWFGPPWLKAHASTWKHEMPDEEFDEATLEVRKKFRTFNIVVRLPKTTYEEEKQILEKRSSLLGACRQLSRVNRFLYNLRPGNKEKRSGSIAPAELHSARMQFVRLAQHDVFQKEIKTLAAGREVSPKSKIANLYPFLDGDGTLRIGGRLQQSSLPFEVKHPVILPKVHQFTKLLVEELHSQNCHAGPSLLTATVNQRYWIQGCQSVIKQVIHNCVRCRRLKAKTAQQLMGSLPAARVTACRPFTHVGVDYAGPIQVRCSNTRGTRCMKGYIVVFVCLSTKAVHLEAVSDLTSQGFISALKRMIARRGYCCEIWSDNGTNLVGADRLLQEIYEAIMAHSKEAEQFLCNLGIKWKFIPPASPHQGGIWEAAVKSAKSLLRPVVGNEKLTFEELSTVLCQIEACLNSRPLCPLSTSPDSLEALTPGHFLVGQPLNMIPEPDVMHLKMNQLDRWQKMQRYSTEFWNRWRDEYIATLQPRGKWRASEENIKPGQLVLVKNDNAPPSAWELARVVAVHPDRAGLVRNVTLRRGKHEYQRSVQKICPLPN